MHQSPRPIVFHALPTVEDPILNYSLSVDRPVPSLRHTEESIIEKHFIHEDAEAEDVLFLGEASIFYSSFTAVLIGLERLGSDIREGKAGERDWGKRVVECLSEV